jgi:hypothetical protein
MFGYHRKTLEIEHQSDRPVTFSVEVDPAADNTWSDYARFTVPPGQTLRHVFPESYSAHWVRLKADSASVATATFSYGSSAADNL